VSRAANDDVAAWVRQPVTVGWDQQLYGRAELSAAPDTGVQRGILAEDLWPTINVSGSNLVTLSLLIVMFGEPGGISANLLYGFDPLNVQNTSRRGGARRRESLEYLGRLEEDGWGNGDPKGLGRLQVDHRREFGGLLDRQIGGVGAIEELPHGGSGAPELLRQAHPLCHETAGLQNLPTCRS
jgi:hypothetical protein